MAFEAAHEFIEAGNHEEREDRRELAEPVEGVSLAVRECGRGAVRRRGHGKEQAG